MLGMKVGMDDTIGTVLGDSVGMVEELRLDGVPAGADVGRTVASFGRMTINEGGLTDVIPLTIFCRSVPMLLLASSASSEATEWFVELVVTMYEKDIEVPKRLKRSNTFTDIRWKEEGGGDPNDGEIEGVALRQRDGDDVGETDGWPVG